MSACSCAYDGDFYFMAYVYRHVRLDTNQVFYIGIGSDSVHKRAKSKANRTRYWVNITAKTEYRVDILCDDLTWEEACDKEREFIALYGRVDMGTGTLVNLTNGGEGMNGILLKEETLVKFRQNKIGNKNAMSKMVINTMNGIYYETIKEAAESIGISRHSLYKKLAGRRNNNTIFSYA